MSVVCAIYLKNIKKSECMMYLKTGRYNCLWCLIPSSKLIESPAKRGSFPMRSLESLKADHTRFLTEGQGNLRVAKQYNNAIGEIFFVIPLNNVRY